MPLVWMRGRDEQALRVQRVRKERRVSMALGHVQGDLDVSARSVRVSGEVLDPRDLGGELADVESRSSAESASNAGVSVASASSARSSCQSVSPSAAAARAAACVSPASLKIATASPRRSLRFGHPVRQRRRARRRVRASRPFERLVGQAAASSNARCASSGAPSAAARSPARSSQRVRRAVATALSPVGSDSTHRGGARRSPRRSRQGRCRRRSRGSTPRPVQPSALLLASVS